nr:hypothetical protein CFP56_79102 [Quercus suber]
MNQYNGKPVVPNQQQNAKHSSTTNKSRSQMSRLSPLLRPSFYFHASRIMLSALIKAPFIFGIGICLALLAIPTTFVALCILTFRGLVMLRYFLLPRHRPMARKPSGPTISASTAIIPETPDPGLPKSRSRRSSVSRRSSIIQDLDRETPRPPSATGSYVSLADVDFEGVGGWRLPHEASWNDDDEALFMSSGSRNSPSVSRRRHHRRTGTGNSSVQRLSGYVTPDGSRTPYTPMGHRRNLSGTASPENYFSYLPTGGGSTTTLNLSERNSKVSFEIKGQSERSSVESLGAGG